MRGEERREEMETMDVIVCVEGSSLMGQVRPLASREWEGKRGCVLRKSRQESPSIMMQMN